MVQFPSTKCHKDVKFAINPIRKYSDEEKLRLLQESLNGDSTQHFEENRTHTRLKENHNWKGMEKNMKELITNCDTYQREKLSNNRHTDRVQ